MVPESRERKGRGKKKSVSTIASQEPMGLQKALAFWDAALISDPLYFFETASRGLHSEQQNSAVWVSRGSIDYCYWLPAAMQLELDCRVFINVTSFIYLEKIVGRARLDHFWGTIFSFLFQLRHGLWSFLCITASRGIILYHWLPLFCPKINNYIVLHIQLIGPQFCLYCQILVLWSINWVPFFLVFHLCDFDQIQAHEILFHGVVAIKKKEKKKRKKNKIDWIQIKKKKAVQILFKFA